MTIPLLDLKREYAAIHEEIQRGWADALSAMHLLQGENVAAFEREIAAYVGTAHACGVASGSDALLLSLLALGIGAGDEVILQTNAFAAALEAIHHAGAQPVLVDVEPGGVGPDTEQVERGISPRTKAILVVHLYGVPLPLTALEALAEGHGLALIEDGSHALGARRDGRTVGSVGRVGCFSAGVVKNLGAYGDAGFVTTAAAALAEQLRVLRAHGQAQKGRHIVYGFNSRLDELQALVLRVKLRYLDARNQRRRAIAAHYSQRFAGLDLQVPLGRAGEVAVYHQYVIRTSQRDRLRAHLSGAGIETGIHYPAPLHRQPAWQDRYCTVLQLPRAEQLAREILSIPVFPDLTDAEVEHIADSVVAFLGPGR